MDPSAGKKEIHKRVLSIDFGLRRLGIALSDERQIIATPYRTVQAGKSMKQTVAKLVCLIQEIEKELHCCIEEIVVGMPLLMSGKKGLIADEVRYFTQQLSAAISVPIHLWDERLTTVQAEKALREGNMNRKRRAQVVDIVSAAILLQSFLDHKRSFMPQQEGLSM